MKTEAYVPTRYRGILLEGGPGDPDAKPWPWKDLAPSDFVVSPDPNAIQFPPGTLRQPGHTAASRASSASPPIQV